MRLVKRQWRIIATEVCERRLKNKNVIDLDTIGFLRTDHTMSSFVLAHATEIARKQSEDGRAVILTFRAGWSFPELKALSRRVCREIPSTAIIVAGTQAERIAIKAFITPIQTAQTVVLTGAVLRRSH